MHDGASRGPSKAYSLIEVRALRDLEGNLEKWFARTVIFGSAHPRSEIAKERALIVGRLTPTSVAADIITTHFGLEGEKVQDKEILSLVTKAIEEIDATLISWGTRA